MTGNVTSQNQSPVNVEGTWRGAMTVVVALSGSIVLYAMIGVVILRSRSASPEPVQLRIPIYALAFFLALASLAYRRTQLRWLRLESVARVKGVDGLVKHLYITTVISSALGEAIGLLGLMLSMLGGDIEDVLGLGLVGLVLILVSFPKRRGWMQTVDYLSSGEEEPVGGQ